MIIIEKVADRYQEGEFMKKKVLIILGSLIIILCIIGMSYAVWRITASQTDTNRITADCFEITLTNEKDMISLENAFPLYDEEGMKLTPYTFTIQNKCASYASYNINLELLDTITEDNRLDPQYLKVVLDENTPTILSSNKVVDPTLSNAYTSYELTTGYLEQNEEKTYNLRLWLDENVTLEDPVVGKSIIAKITVTANYIDHIPTDYEKCVSEYGEDSIQCSIIANVDTTGACPTVNEDGTVNITDIEDTESLVCTAPDDYGTSYYFRGTVENNWVKFAGFYWRILRINGDGSIRMIYAGDANVIDNLENKEEVLANGYSDWNTHYTQIGESDYNSNSNDNAYAGYMYGTLESSTYDETHANINDSAIKTVLDNWYKTNIEDARYSSYISDTLFCNDRSFNERNTGTGTGTSTTYYRWYHGPWSSTGTQYPRLTCIQKNDRFTVDDKRIGNGNLTYPVALLTTDEAVLAGGYNVDNSEYYLYTGNEYWTMSPRDFFARLMALRIISNHGAPEDGNNAYVSYGVRPVINLKPNSLKSGDGTSLNPYRVD